MSELHNPDQGEPATGWVRVWKRRSRGGHLLVGIICLALVVGAGVLVVAHAKSAATTRRHQASAAAAQFLRTWASGNLSALPAQTVTGSATVAQAYAALDLAPGITTKPSRTAATSPTPTPTAAGLPITFELATPIGSGDVITVPTTITIDIPALGTWRNPTKLRVRTAGNRSLVDWSPQAIAPALKSGDQIRVTRTVPSRPAILGTDGQPLPVSADARALIGTVGPATAAQAKPDPALLASDLIGQIGLQASSDATLRGAPSGNLTVVDPAGTLWRLWPGGQVAPPHPCPARSIPRCRRRLRSRTGHRHLPGRHQDPRHPDEGTPRHRHPAPPRMAPRMELHPQPARKLSVLIIGMH